MANIILDHGVSGCFGTNLAPSRRSLPHHHVAVSALRKARSRRNRAFHSATIDRRSLCFLKDYFARLEECCHLIPLRKLELVDSLPCDCRRDLQLSCVQSHASHGCSLLNVCHPSAHSVSCAYLDCASVSFDKDSFRGFDVCYDGVVLPKLQFLYGLICDRGRDSVSVGLHGNDAHCSTSLDVRYSPTYLIPRTDLTHCACRHRFPPNNRVNDQHSCKAKSLAQGSPPVPAPMCLERARTILTCSSEVAKTKTEIRGSRRVHLTA